MTFVLTVVIETGTGSGGAHGADEVEVVVGGEEPLVEVRAPAAKFGDGVAEGHVAENDKRWNTRYVEVGG